MLKVEKMKIIKKASSEKSNEVAHNEPPHLSLHCLPTILWSLIKYSQNKTFFWNFVYSFFFCILGVNNEYSNSIHIMI